MLENKLTLLSYALTGLFLALWPILIRFFPPVKDVGISHRFQRNLTILYGICIFLLAGQLIFVSTSIPQFLSLMISFILIAAMSGFHNRRFMPVQGMSVLAALIFATTLPWWRRMDEFGLKLSWLETTLFLAIVIGFLWAIKRSTSRPSCSWIAVGQLSLFVLIATVLSFTTITRNNPTVLLLTWHHWGAFIGPSELLLSGALIFRDFPAQYGFGPTTLIALACAENCWNGMYYLVGSTTLLFAFLITKVALAIVKQATMQRGMVLILSIVCCFFWASYPPLVLLPTSTPSVTGFRFLPVVALVVLLLGMDSRLYHQPHFAKFGHVAWAAASLWSPESGFYATCIWWPYYLLLRCQKFDDRRSITLGLLRALGSLLLMMFGLVLSFNVGYWFVYHTTPTGIAYFAYVLNPPGPLSINVTGAIWFFIIVIVLATIANWHMFRQTGNSPTFRRGLLLTLLSYATFSYFIGRSHDNNILNLSPFLMLILLHTFATANRELFRLTAATLLACLLGWVSVFGWDAWKELSDPFRAVQFDPEWVRAALPDGSSDAMAASHGVYPEDGVRAISIVRTTYHESATMVDMPFGLASTASDSVWSAFHCPANMWLFPSTLRRIFLANTANTLKRSGWLVIKKDFAAGELLEDFDSVYSRTHELDLGTYHAIRFAPR